MCSEGIELNPSEDRSTDPYTESRRQPQHTYTTPSTYDKLRQFLELDRHVLMFSCVWDDRDNMFGEMRPNVSLDHILIVICILMSSHSHIRIVSNSSVEKFLYECWLARVCMSTELYLLMRLSLLMRVIDQSGAYYKKLLAKRHLSNLIGSFTVLFHRK